MTRPANRRAAGCRIGAGAGARFRLVHLAAAAGALAACDTDRMAGPPPVEPAFAPGPKTAQFAFTSNRDGNWEIYRVNADGTGLLRLTNHAADDGPNGQGGYDIAWSPDGSQVAFTSNRSGSVDIWVMNADGSRLTSLTNTAGNEHDLAWSPDGTRIAFARKRPADIYPDIWFVTTTGKPAETNLTATAYVDEGQPTWSDDGQIVAFRSDPSGWPDPPARIAVVHLDGGSVSSSDDWSARHTDPSWSPVGTPIAYISNADGDDDIYTFLPDGTSKTLLLDHAGADARPRWSPDGSKLVFENTTTGTAGVWVVNSNGTSPLQVALSGTAGPSWSRDGTRVAYERHDTYVTQWQIRPVSDIYTVLPSGSSPLLVVAGPTSRNLHPVWRP